MRIVEGKESIEFNSCALKSDDEDEEEAVKLFFFLISIFY